MARQPLNETNAAVAEPRGWVRRWPRWSPYAALAWSLGYGALAVYWALSGNGFPYAPGVRPEAIEPLAARLGPGVAWAVVIAVGLPAAVLATAMLRGVRTARPALITAGGLLSAVLLLAMTDVGLLQTLGYTPYVIVGLITGAEVGRTYLDAVTGGAFPQQLLCLLGGFLWLMATAGYARRSAGACLDCGRTEDTAGWASATSAARWGRVAVYAAMVTPLLYAATRFAWALGIPLGISEEFLRSGQEGGMWVSGVFLAAFGLVGAVLTLGLIQRWGEVFPRWMPGLSGKRVPIALAVVPASIVSVLMMVGGIAMWSGYAQMVAGSVSGAAGGMGLIAAAPTALFPLWGAALAAAALAYYYRRRGKCGVCGRG